VTDSLSKFARLLAGLGMGLLWAAAWWNMFAGQPLVEPRSTLVVIAFLLTALVSIPYFLSKKHTEPAAHR
jgi:hypothetical protein